MDDMDLHARRRRALAASAPSRVRIRRARLRPGVVLLPRMPSKGFAEWVIVERRWGRLLLKPLVEPFGDFDPPVEVLGEPRVGVADIEANVPIRALEGAVAVETLSLDTLEPFTRAADLEEASTLLAEQIEEIRVDARVLSELPLPSSGPVQALRERWWLVGGPALAGATASELVRTRKQENEN